MKTIGYYSALSTTIIATVTFIVAVLTPPLSGPWCTSGCLEYPFHNIAARFPRDYLWMYPAMLLSFAFIVLMASIHEYAHRSRKVYSLSALLFAAISSATLFIDYFVQVSVIQQSVLNGETEGVSLLTQYNSHGIFIALEEAGYFLMSLALFCTVPVFAGSSRLGRAIRVTYIASFLLTILAFIIISFLYGINREYRFEVAVITIEFLTLIVSGIMLSRIFKHAAVDNKN